MITPARPALEVCELRPRPSRGVFRHRRADAPALVAFAALRRDVRYWLISRSAWRSGVDFAPLLPTHHRSHGENSSLSRVGSNHTRESGPTRSARAHAARSRDLAYLLRDIEIGWLDPAGNWKQYATDALGNLVMVLEPDPTQNPVVGPPALTTYPVATAPSGTLLTTYTYDQYNHLTQVSMPRNTVNGMKKQTRTFVYNSTSYSTLTLPTRKGSARVWGYPAPAE